MMTSGTVVKRLVEDTSDVSVIVRQKPECHAVIASAAEGLGMRSRARDSVGKSQVRVPTAILAQERGGEVSFGDWSWETNPDVVEMAPTVPIPAQWAEPSGEVGRCVEHRGRA